MSSNLNLERELKRLSENKIKCLKLDLKNKTSYFIFAMEKLLKESMQ